MQQILSFEKLKTENVMNFCLKIADTIIKIVADTFSVLINQFIVIFKYVFSRPVPVAVTACDY